MRRTGVRCVVTPEVELRPKERTQTRQANMIPVLYDQITDEDPALSWWEDKFAASHDSVTRSCLTPACKSSAR